MKSGPKKKPNHLKLAAGNPGKRPLNDNEPKPRPVAPECPEWISEDAQAEWKRLAPELEHMGLLTVVDGIAFSILCQEISIYKAATKEINENLFVQAYKKKAKNPAIQVARDAANLIKAFCAEFGLTPSARAGLSIPSQESDNDDDIFDT